MTADPIEPTGQARTRSGRGRKLFAIYALLMLASYVTWGLRGPRVIVLGPEETVLVVPSQTSDGPTAGLEAMAVCDVPADAADAPVIVLLHGSPGSIANFDALAESLRGRYRLVIPDLPGFGASPGPVPDYSIRAHARYVLHALDELGVEDAHFVGFSMGGGVALEAFDLAPERVASVVLLASIGVQELELLGRYDLNHGVHGILLVMGYGARYAFPHFGAANGLALMESWGRNFYDTDQRPLRGILERIDVPVRILHGEFDPLVPLAAAHEHHRIVPHSTLRIVKDHDHFLPWKWTAPLAEDLSTFVDEVVADRAPRRSQATPQRLAAAELPFDPKSVPPLDGLGLWVAILVLAAATLASEDLTCIAAGLLIAQGRISFLGGTFGCFAGIFLGDVWLFLMGRMLGRPALRRAPLKWMISEPAVERASQWFTKKGAQVILASRFMPGLRLPTYFAAGAVGTRLSTFCLWFALAGVLWTPILVGLSAWAGDELGLDSGELTREAVFAMLGLILTLLVIARVGIPACTWRGRRMLLGKWRRWRHWEFWPAWLLYAPIVPWFFWLALRHRGLTLTAANPGMPEGGFVGESKQAILDALGDGPEMAHFRRVPAELTLEERRRVVHAFRSEHALGFPIVLKPDAGQRGSGVLVRHSEVELEDALTSMGVDSIVQEYLVGDEFGVFWMNHPAEPAPRVISVTTKILPTVTGDGRRTLERLILADARAVACAQAYFDNHADRLLEVVPEGEVVPLVELGTHARGAIFQDGADLITPELESAITSLASRFDGFAFGRFDVRAPSAAHLARGEDLKVIELNGVTSEMTHIYDRRHGWGYGMRTLFRQWRWAFEVGAEQARNGAHVSGLRDLWRAWRSYRRDQRRHR